MSAPLSCEEPRGGWVRSGVVRRLAAILEGSWRHVPHLGKGALVRFAEWGRGWQCSRGPRAWAGYYPSLYVRMSGELSRPIDIASGESGGRLGGFRTGPVGMCRTLGRGLGGGGCGRLCGGGGRGGGGAGGGGGGGGGKGICDLAWTRSDVGVFWAFVKKVVSRDERKDKEAGEDGEEGQGPHWGDGAHVAS